MRKPPSFFRASMFTATKWHPAEDKAAFANNLLAFIEAGFPENLLTKALYVRLCSAFGFIAHSDRQGFWGEYFTTKTGQARFLQCVLAHPCYGDPAWTFSDAENEIRRRLDHLGLYEYYAQLAKQEQEYAERTRLAELQARYTSPVSLLPSPTPLAMNLGARIQVAPEKELDVPAFPPPVDGYEQVSLFG